VRASWVFCLAFVASISVAGEPASASASVPPARCSGWSVVPSASAADWNELLAVSADDPHDAWAVGDAGPFAAPQTLAEHWDGHAWSIVRTVHGPFADSNVLDGVAVVSRHDVWAVGLSHDADASNWAPLAEHWNGTRWRPARVAPASNGSQFNGVAALSANDVWAVGAGAPPGDPNSGTLTEHWDGQAWTLVASPNPGREIDTLAAVAAIAHDDVWAVGSQSNDLSGTHTLIEHWDGSAWSVVPSPDGVGSGLNDLRASSATSSSDVWAAGGTYVNGLGYGDLFEHWDGVAWSVVPGPPLGVGERAIRGVAVVSSSRVWAVGDRLGKHPNYATMVDRWHGSAWRHVSSPSPGMLQNFLNGAAGIPGSRAAWAVGHRFDGGGPWTTLIERSC
jgi:hypothetical protein